jgi:hypothetical protein
VVSARLGDHLFVDMFRIQTPSRSIAWLAQATKAQK